MALGVLNPKDPIQRVLDQIFQTLKDRVQTPKDRVQTLKDQVQTLKARVQTLKVLLPQNPEAVEHSGAAWRLKLKVEPD